MTYYCPCCSDVLLQHVKSAQIYWFCRSCWQEMPILSSYAALSVSSLVKRECYFFPVPCSNHNFSYKESGVGNSNPLPCSS